MPRSIPALRAICAVLAGASALAQAAPAPPPAAPVAAASDTYFGTTVTDSYRGMEDLSAPDVQQWARAQGDYARAVLDAIPGRAALLARLRELDASARERVADVRQSGGGLVFYAQRRGGEQQPRLYVRKGFKGAERLLVDPDKGGRGRKAIAFFRPSHDGRYVAYGIAAGASADTAIHVLDVASGKDSIEPIERAQCGDLNWLPDDSGFLYLRLQALPAGAPQTEKFRNSTTFMHRLAASGPDTAILGPGVNDRLEVPFQEFPVVDPLAGTPWAVAILRDGSQREIELYAAPIAAAADPKAKWRRLFGRDAGITGYAIHGDGLYLLSHLSASRYKVLRTSMAHPDVAMAEVVVAPGREVIDRIVAARDALYVAAHDGSAGRLYRVGYAKNAQPVAVALPAEGAVDIVDGDASRPGVVVAVASWTRGEAIYGVGAKDGQVADTGLQAAASSGAPGGLVAEEVLAKSHDGTDVPLSIVHRRGMKLDGDNPVDLHAYGAYGVVDAPAYVERQLAWYELGGVMATCHVRGGGINGEEWHLGGRQLTKPNTWKDLVACGEYLVRKGYTNVARMAIEGDGAGGIAVGRALTERSDLWAAVVSDAGELDPLRAETSAAGVPDIPEFGTVADRPQFNGLLEMDAFHHVEDGVKYPAVLLLPGLDGSHVPAWQSLKMAARLQAATGSGKPVLLRQEDDGGPGSGGAQSELEERDADRWSFMLWQFGDPRFQPAAR